MPEYLALAEKLWNNFPARRANRLNLDLARLTQSAEQLFNLKEDP